MFIQHHEIPQGLQPLFILNHKFVSFAHLEGQPCHLQKHTKKQKLSLVITSQIPSGKIIVEQFLYKEEVSRYAKFIQQGLQLCCRNCPSPEIFRRILHSHNISGNRWLCFQTISRPVMVFPAFLIPSCEGGQIKNQNKKLV